MLNVFNETGNRLNVILNSDKSFFKVSSVHYKTVRELKTGDRCRK